MPSVKQIRDVPKKVVRRQPKEFQEIHEKADRIELRMARSFIRAVGRLRKKVMVSELNVALSLRDERRALREASDRKIQESLSPVGTIARDAVIEGGKIGAKILRDE